MTASPLRAAHLARGARLAERDGAEIVLGYGDVDAEVAALRAGAGLAELAFPVLSLQGSDARRWANGQFTNRLRDLPPDRLVQCAMVDDKARVQGLLDAWCPAEDHLLLTLQGVGVARFTERYEKYIIFDDVEQEDRSDDLRVLTVQGPSAAAVLAAAGLPAPPAEGEAAVADGVRVGRRARSRAGGYDLLVPTGALAAVWARLVDAGAVPVGDDALEVVRVEAGLVRFPVDVGEKALPHELRIVDRMCSFEKGCYIGQEVVNRIDVMGQVAKKLWALELDAVPAPGSALTLDGNPVGHTLSGVMDGGRARVLAILRKPAWAEGTVVQVEGVGPATVRDVPVGK